MSFPNIPTAEALRKMTYLKMSEKLLLILDRVCNFKSVIGRPDSPILIKKKIESIVKLLKLSMPSVDFNNLGETGDMDYAYIEIINTTWDWIKEKDINNLINESIKGNHNDICTDMERTLKMVIQLSDFQLARHYHNEFGTNGRNDAIIKLQAAYRGKRGRSKARTEGIWENKIPLDIKNLLKEQVIPNLPSIPSINRVLYNGDRIVQQEIAKKLLKTLIKICSYKALTKVQSEERRAKLGLLYNRYLHFVYDIRNFVDRSIVNTDAERDQQGVDGPSFKRVINLFRNYILEFIDNKPNVILNFFIGLVKNNPNGVCEHLRDEFESWAELGDIYINYDEYDDDPGHMHGENVPPGAGGPEEVYYVGDGVEYNFGKQKFGVYMSGMPADYGGIPKYTNRGHSWKWALQKYKDDEKIRKQDYWKGMERLRSAAEYRKALIKANKPNMRPDLGAPALWRRKIDSVPHGWNWV
jgi:hypothetical protein